MIPTRTTAGYIVRCEIHLGGRDADGKPRLAMYEIECVAGDWPRVRIEATGLTRNEQRELHDRIEQTCAHLRIRCRCGAPWSDHADASPHAAAIGDCRAFSAVSPLEESEPR